MEYVLKISSKRRLLKYGGSGIMKYSLSSQISYKYCFKTNSKYELKIFLELNGIHFVREKDSCYVNDEETFIPFIGNKRFNKNVIPSYKVFLLEDST